ncbi:hypothetical protein HRG_012789 [Hirsutella rhossiliensis]
MSSAFELVLLYKKLEDLKQIKPQKRTAFTKKTPSYKILFSFDSDIKDPEQIYTLCVPPGQSTMFVPWKRRWRERPIFRDIQGRGKNYGKAQKLLVRLGRALGYEKLLEWYDLRWGSGMRLNKALTAEDRNQSTGQTLRDSSTFFKLYVVDRLYRSRLPEIVFDSKPQHDITHLMGRLFRLAGAPTHLVYKQPRLSRLRCKKPQIVRKINEIGYTLKTAPKTGRGGGLLQEYIKWGQMADGARKTLHDDRLTRAISDFRILRDGEEIARQSNSSYNLSRALAALCKLQEPPRPRQRKQPAEKPKKQPRKAPSSAPTKCVRPVIVSALENSHSLHPLSPPLPPQGTTPFLTLQEARCWLACLICTWKVLGSRLRGSRTRYVLLTAKKDSGLKQLRINSKGRHIDIKLTSDIARLSPTESQSIPRAGSILPPPLIQQDTLPFLRCSPWLVCFLLFLPAPHLPSDALSSQFASTGSAGAETWTGGIMLVLDIYALNKDKDDRNHANESNLRICKSMFCLGHPCIPSPAHNSPTSFLLPQATQHFIFASSYIALARHPYAAIQLGLAIAQRGSSYNFGMPTTLSTSTSSRREGDLRTYDPLHVYTMDDISGEAHLLAGTSFHSPENLRLLNQTVQDFALFSASAWRDRPTTVSSFSDASFQSSYLSRLERILNRLPVSFPPLPGKLKSQLPSLCTDDYSIVINHWGLLENNIHPSCDKLVQMYKQ